MESRFMLAQFLPDEHLTVMWLNVLFADRVLTNRHNRCRSR